jgi:hypothetical protein
MCSTSGVRESLRVRLVMTGKVKVRLLDASPHWRAGGPGRSRFPVVGGIPDLDLEKIRRYASGRVPPEFQDQIRMEVDVRGKTVTIVECRPPWPGNPRPEWIREGIARMKYGVESKKWTLYWVDSNDRWHNFHLIAPGSIDELLEEIEQDRTNIFWG